MGRIHVHEFITVDGVFESPSWTAAYPFTSGMIEEVGRWTSASTAILLGRSTFQMFAPAWSGRSAEEDPGAPFFNDTPKFVVSSTLTSADEWQNSTVIGGYDAGRIRALKDETDGDIYISGSGMLVRSLLADGLVDELHLLVYPIVLGGGARLFGGDMPRTPLALAQSQQFENGVQLLTYSPPAA